MNQMRSRLSFGRIAATTLETLAWVGLATAFVAILDSVATPAGLGSIYLIAVLAVAIRRGQVAALAAAVLGVLVLNFFFIKPLHQLTIADSDNVVALGTLLLAALVVGRLAGQSRRRAAEAELRAEQAAAREREAAMLAEAATALLGGTDDLVSAISASLESAGRGELRLETSSAPQPRGGEVSLRLPTEARSVWLYATGSDNWTRGGSESNRHPAGSSTRRGRRARASRRARRRGRGRATGRCREDGDPSCGLT